jgi:biotin carboxylase
VKAAMDLLYLSPDFPPNYANFIDRLNRRGVRVWGLGEADFFHMPEHLQAALKWYARADLNHDASVRRAVDALLDAKHRSGFPGGFDRIESHNEQWLRLEGFLNERLGIEGITSRDLDRLKKKSVMKRLFIENGFPAAAGARVASLEHGLRLAGELGYPLILKPDEGVGAAGIHRIENDDQLRGRLSALLETGTDYVLEEFIDAPIVTYDGLTDADGRVIFENSLIYGSGVLDCVLGKDTFFFVTRRIPAALSAAGRSLVAAFDIRRKFFHFEFFLSDGAYVPIEINCRPPGGAILDMMNYSIDADLYDAYAGMLVGDRVPLPEEKSYFCCYVGRRDRAYRRSHTDILSRYGDRLMEFAENPPVYRQAMGRYRYILRSGTEADLRQMAAYLLESA